MNDHYFGYKKVKPQEKVQKVNEVFSSVAQRYDLMNDLMSAGVHRLWKRRALKLAAIRPHECVLDLATGSGDLALKIADRLSQPAQLTASDINADMLEQAKLRFIDAGLADIQCALADAEALPFESQRFDCITIAFGLRNVTHQTQALNEMFRVLKPGGRLIILEFSHLRAKALQKAYDAYSFSILPKLGEIVTSDRASYQYLAESIRMHPTQEALLAMMSDAGFVNTNCYNVSGGIVAIHRGYKA